MQITEVSGEIETFAIGCSYKQKNTRFVLMQLLAQQNLEARWRVSVSRCGFGRAAAAD